MKRNGPTLSVKRQLRACFYILTTSIVSCLALQANAQVSVTATAGTTGPTTYTTLKGAFDAVNAGTHQGSITISITASTTETATASLNASGSGSASYTAVNIAPAASTTPSISGSISSGPVVKLNGSNNVTINGSNNNTTTRDLTITNTSTTSSNVLQIGSVGTTPVTNVMVKNCSIINGTNTSTAVLVGDAAVVGSPGYFSNITIQNNSIQKAYIGLYCYATVATGNGNNTIVTGNDLNSSGTNAIRLVGVYMQGLNGATISNNNIGNFETASAEFDRAIWLATGTTNTTVSGNTISGLNYSGTSSYAPIGINVSPGVTSANVTVSGNTITNLTSSGTGTTMGIFSYSAASGITFSKNKVSNIKNTNTGGYGAAGMLFASTINTAATDIVNNFVWDVAAYGYNGYGSGDNGNGIVIDGGGGYNIYFNTVLMNTDQTLTGGHRSSALLVTANVTASGVINLRNNVLVNTQTIGNANSRLVLSDLASSGSAVFSAIDYNDYYATSTNLSSLGTNASITNTLAQLQTSLGSNTNSKNIQPVFVSATDLHMVPGSNITLGNLGLTISGITSDIDGDTRTATPDMGADEFITCTAVNFTTQPANTATCVNSNASFTIATSNGTQYQWQVNTGSGFTNITNNSTYSGATTATLTITGATAAMSGYTYRCQVTVTAACGATPSNAATLTVNSGPAATITAGGSTTFCTGGSVVLNATPTGSNFTYQWQQNSSNISGATNASYTATASGNYTVLMTNTTTACSATSAATTVTVGPPPTAAITPSGTVNICQNSTTSLSAGSGTGLTYQWSQGGTPIPNATNATYIASAAGSYTVAVSSGPGCTSTSAATTVNTISLPTATITPSGNVAICQNSNILLNANTGSGLTYQWLQGGGNISGATNASYTATAAGSYTVKVTNTSTTCVNTSAATTVTVNSLPSVAITPNTTQAICPGDSVVFASTAPTATAYQWLQNGTPASNATTSSFKAFAAGSYALKVTDANGCSGVSPAVTVNVNPGVQAIITYTTPVTFCEGGAVVLTAGPPGTGYTYQWRKDTSAIAGATLGYNIVEESGFYTVTVTNNFGCKGVSQPTQVIVNPLPNPVVTRNGTVLSTGATYSYYQWYRNGQPMANGTSPSINVTQNGGYYVEVTDANGCKNRSDLIFVDNVGIKGITAGDANILLYPNPAHDVITIENKSREHMTHVYIISPLGSIIYDADVQQDKEQIQVGGLASGVYTIRIITGTGMAVKRLEILH
jgi:hypothetical protein